MSRGCVQVESGRAVLGVRRDPVGVVGTDRHQAVRNSEEVTKTEVASPAPALLARQPSARPWSSID